MIHIINYGLGNIQAFLNAYKRLGIDAKSVRNADELVNVEKLILPGVGAFDKAMQLFNNSGLRQEVEQLVQKQQIPVLGICVGMQMLAQNSEEGQEEGLGWIAGKVKNFSNQPYAALLPMPHMGWNDVRPSHHCPLFKGFSEDIRFYFLHSFYYECANEENIGAVTEYGFPFHCAVQKRNIFGVQFHPEKSHHWGELLLKNFAEL